MSSAELRRPAPGERPKPRGIHYEPRRLPFTGPDTTGQLVALDHLERLAGAQHAPAQSVLTRRLAQSPWPLFLVLIIQAALSLRLVWANTAFQDEALYLWAGHLEWAHWLDGRPIPDFATYFSGSPVVYPPLGALADSVGGLAGARILSLLLLLGATCLLWDMTRIIYDKRAGYFAAALFAGLASTQYLGAFATYDAMALSLLALAAWLVVRARGRASEPLIMVAAAVMVLANAAKYASALWDPIVIAIAVLLAERGHWVRRLFRGARFAAYAIALIALALTHDRASYLKGILLTTVDRSSARSSALGVFWVSAGWVGVVALCAGIGVAAAFVRRGDWRFRLTSISLATAAILAPANQARIHTIVSLFKHVGFGAWFAASVGGYALSSLTAAVPAAKVLLAVRVSAAVAVATGVVGSLLATSHYHAWPNARSFTGALGPILRDTPGPIVASEETYVISYYLSDASPRHVFADPGYFSYTDPYTHTRLHGNSAYADAIENRYFGIIALPFDADMQADDAIRSDIDLYGGYVLVATIPYTANGLSSAYRIWVREG